MASVSIGDKLRVCWPAQSGVNGKRYLARVSSVGAIEHEIPGVGEPVQGFWVKFSDDDEVEDFYPLQSDRWWLDKEEDLRTPCKKVKIERSVVVTPPAKTSTTTTSSMSITTSIVKTEGDKKFSNLDIPANLRRFLITKQDFTKLRTLASKYRTEYLLKKFERYLLQSSYNHSAVSPANARLVMKQLIQLWKGRGIRYDSPQYAWPADCWFMKDVCCNPFVTDLVHLKVLAIEAERMYGRDHGNGWLLRHPIQKMILFREFILDERGLQFLEKPLKTDIDLKVYDINKSGSDVWETSVKLKEENDEYEDYIEVVEPPPKPEKVVFDLTNDDDDDDDDDEDEERRAAAAAERQRQEEDEEDVKFEIKREIKAEAQARTNNARGNYVGMRVAKFFNGIAYPGVVKGLNDDDKEPWWNIVYDDGDKEDLNETELQLGLKLHREKFGGETKRRLF